MQRDLREYWASQLCKTLWIGAVTFSVLLGMTLHWCKCSLSGSQKPHGDWFRRCPGYSWRVVNCLLLRPFLLSASSSLLLFSPHSGIRKATKSKCPFVSCVV